MVFYAESAMGRAMKIQEVILRAMAKKITWCQAAEINGISDRQMRRWYERYREFGYDGLFDRRLGRPSPKRVPVETVERLLGLYRERYFDLNVRHFCEKLRELHHIRLSYTWVKTALQGAGLVKKGRSRGAHRRRRARRPLPGMLLHLDGSRHRWFQDDRWYDLLVVLDDANSEIYYAQLVEEESTRTVMAALREVIERKGTFCALYSDRASHFFETPRAGGKIDPQKLTQVGRALRELDIQMIPAYSPQSLGAKLRHLAGASATRIAPARNHHAGKCQRIFARGIQGRVQSALPCAADSARTCVRALPGQGFGFRVLDPANARGRSGQHRSTGRALVPDRIGGLAQQFSGWTGHRARASGWYADHTLRTAHPRSLQRPGLAVAGTDRTTLPEGCGKDAAWKTQTRFPTPLGNPATPAGFPLSHSHEGGG